MNTKPKTFAGRWLARFGVIPVLLLYLVPMLCASSFYFSITTIELRIIRAEVMEENPDLDLRTEFTDWDAANYLYLLYWLGIVATPLVLTVGVFTLYRNNYQSHTVFIRQDFLETISDQSLATDAATEGKAQDEWQRVLRKAIDWNRFLLPLCFFNMFVTVVPLAFLTMDIWSTEEVEGEMVYGLGIPGSVFFFGFMGFVVYFLEMTRRRYISRNIVPHFYMSSAFRFLYVVVVIPVFYIFLQVFNVVDVDNTNFAIVTAFLLGMFPLQFLEPINRQVRKRLGMTLSEELPVSLINGVNNTLESILQEENIDSIQALAMMDIDHIHTKTAIPKNVIAGWKSQAKLFYTLGDEELIRLFARMGINDFDDLAVLADADYNRRATKGISADDDLVANFKEAMTKLDNTEAYQSQAFWDVLVVVLAREYDKEHNILPDHVARRANLTLAEVQKVPEIQVEVPEDATLLTNEVAGATEGEIADDEPVGSETPTV